MQNIIITLPSESFVHLSPDIIRNERIVHESRLLKEKAHQQQRGSLLKYIDPGSICKDDTPSSPPQNQ